MGGGVEEHRPVVIDSGSHRIKAGFAGDDDPTTDFPTILGITHKDSWDRGNILVGDRFNPHIPCLSVRRPKATDWDIMELIWEHTFSKELEVDPFDVPVLMTGHSYYNKQNRSKIMEILIEHFNVPYVLIQDQAQLALFSTGKTSGVVLELGEGSIYTAAGKDGNFQFYMTEDPLGSGKEITNYLSRILPIPGVPAGSYSAHELTRKIKERMSFVSPYSSIASSSGYWEPKHYELPDGTLLAVGWHSSSCAEMLFDPSVAGNRGDGIHELLNQAIQQCDPELRPMLYKNIVVVGGTARLEYLQERLTAELRQLVPAGTSFEIEIPRECLYSSWIGGSIVASLASAFRDMFTSKAAYDEFGPNNIPAQ